MKNTETMLPEANAPAQTARTSPPAPVAGPSQISHVQTKFAPLIAGGGGTVVEVEVSILPTPFLHPTQRAETQGTELQLPHWFFGVAT